MSSVPHRRRASLPALQHASLQQQLSSSKPERGKSKLSRLLFRSKNTSSSDKLAASMECVADVIPEHDVIEPPQSAVPTLTPFQFPLSSMELCDSPPRVVAQSADDSLTERRGSSLDDDVATHIPWQYRRRRGSLPASAMPSAMQAFSARKLKLKKSKSADKLPPPGKRSRLFAVTVTLPSGFAQEVRVSNVYLLLLFTANKNNVRFILVIISSLTFAYIMYSAL